MGQFASRIHSKEDGKVYNILPLGDMPTVVFGRVIKENSVPGMQYYFPDGRVKWLDINEDIGYSYVKPFPKSEDDEDREWGVPCIFTVPENLDFSKMNDVEYVKQYCRTAINLNANTMSPNYVIINGNLTCIKTIESNGSGVVIAQHSYNVPTEDHNIKITHGKRIREIHRIKNFKGRLAYRNRFVLAPIGRVKYKRVCGERTFYRYKQSVFHYNVRKIVMHSDETKNRVWKLKLM